MILDTSGLLAILLTEPEAPIFAQAIEGNRIVRLSVASYLETAAYVDRRGGAVSRALLDTFLEEFAIRLEPVTVEQARLAREAYRAFGKGMHPASLNFGDCFTYALAKFTREPVLFKGNGFSQTDLVPAVVL